MNNDQLVVPVSIIVKKLLTATAASRVEVLDIVQNTWTFRAPVMHSAGSSAMVLYSRQEAQRFVSHDAEVESPFEQLLYSMSKELFDHCYTNAWEEVPDFKSIDTQTYFINEYDFEIKAESSADLDRFAHCAETLWLMSQHLSERDKTSYSNWLGLAWEISHYWHSMAFSDDIYDKKLDLYRFYREVSKLSLLSKSYKLRMEDMVQHHEDNTSLYLVFMARLKVTLEHLGSLEIAEQIRRDFSWFGSHHAFEDIEPGFWSKTIRQQYPPFATYNAVITFSYILGQLGLLSQEDINYLLSNFKQ